MDQGLLPVQYRPGDRDRIIAYGRWIVDDGHNDFHTEIHTPLMLAWARPVLGPSQSTSGPVETGYMQNAVINGGVATPFAGYSTFSRVITRPYFVSQYFADGKSIRQHLLDQAVSFSGVIGTVDPWDDVVLDAVPMVSASPFQGSHTLMYTVRVPQPRQHPTDELMVCYHFTIRDRCSVTLAQAGDDGISISIKLTNEDPCLQLRNQLNGVENRLARAIGLNNNPPANASANEIAAYGKARELAGQAATQAQNALNACLAKLPSSQLPYPPPALPSLSTYNITFDALNAPPATSLKGQAAEAWASAVTAKFTVASYVGQSAPVTTHDWKDLTWVKPVKDLSVADRTVHTVSNDQPFPVAGWIIVGWGT